MTEHPIVEERNPRTIQNLMPIILVLLLAALLRMNGIAHTPVSTDEGWTTWAISSPVWGDVVEKVATDRHPPMYFMALAYWSRIAGDSHFALRMPSVLVGVLTVAMVFRMGADTFGRTVRPGRQDVSWYGMLMFAVLPLAIYYSQEIRHYGWFVASVTWSSLLFMRLLRTPRWHLLVLYSISVAMMMYLLYFAVWVIGLHVLVGLVMWRGDYRIQWRTTPRDKFKLALTWAVALALYVPWLIVIARYQWAILTSGISGAPGTFTSNPHDVLTLMELLMGGGLALTAGLYTVGIWGSLVSDRTDVTLGLRFANPTWLGEFFVMLWGLGLFILMVIGNNFTGLLSARTTAFLSPAFMLVVGAGIVRLRVGVRWSLLAAFIAVSLWLPPIIQPRLDTTTAAETLVEQVNNGDLIILETGWDDNGFRYELIQAGADPDHIIRTLPWVNNRDMALPVIPQIQDQLENARRVWVVQWLQPSQVLDWLDDGNADYEQALVLTSPVGEAYRYRFETVGGDAEIDIKLYVRSDLESRIDWTFGDTVILDDWWQQAIYTAGESAQIDTWWRLAASTDIDYSVGMYLFSEDGDLIAEQGIPLGRVAPTSQWEMDTAYHTQHTLTIPDDTPAGRYRLETAVYYHETPNEPLEVEGGTRWILEFVEVR